MKGTMIFRFSLYGFLKNQQYYEPFFLLFLIDQKLDFTTIGLLIAFRELVINLLEVPSGAAADVFGRRKSMAFSMAAYILSFILFYLSAGIPELAAAMFFFAVGESFRTGTHKAMIFSWLRMQGRLDEKHRVYGYTRSWSKIGSAVSILIATAFVLWTKNYRAIFLFSAFPYVLGLVNILAYPRELDETGSENRDPRAVFRLLLHSLKKSVASPGLRRLILESMSFEGMFRSAKDYLQPLVKQLALGIPLFLAMEDTGRTAVLVGAVYFILYILSAWASRVSHVLAEKSGSEERASVFLWIANALLYAAMAAALYFQNPLGAVLAFILLYVTQNFWRPLLISRFDSHAEEAEGATILSIENQAKTFSSMLIAPLLGFAVDSMGRAGIGGTGIFIPIGILGALLSLVMIPRMKRGF